MKPLRLLLAGLLLAASISPAFARCVANGKTYDAGTVIGNYKCQPDGTWAKVR
jgi:hypothetical protein